jgi:L-threonylcarbamoyladenylate synthase
MKIPNSIEEAAKYICNGKLVAFPTETVYGLGANALNPMAVAKIFELKERPSFDPLIIHIANIDQLEKLVLCSDKRVYKLAERFWPGPLTMVLPKSDIVPDIVTSGLPTVGIRMPSNKIALDLIRIAPLLPPAPISLDGLALPQRPTCGNSYPTSIIFSKEVKPPLALNRP